MSDAADRRRSTRVEVLGQIHGEAITLDLPVVVREISLGGMSIETPRAFEVGSINAFLLRLGDGAGVDVAGRVVYSRPEPQNQSVYVSGIQFVDLDDLDPETPVGGLLGKVK